MKRTKALNTAILTALVWTLSTVFVYAADSETVTVEASAQPVETLVGDSITLSVKVTAPVNAELKIRQPEKEIGGLDIKSVEQKDGRKLSGNRVLLETVYTLESFTVGTYIIPEQVVEYRMNTEEEFSTAQSSRIFIEIKSVTTKMPDAPKNDIIDIKPQMELRNRTMLIVTVCGTLIILALLVYFFIRHKNRKKVSEAIATEPPHITALNSLEKIQSAGLEVKEYYFRVSKVLRRYIEDRFNIPVTEKTSEEFISDMTRSDFVPDKNKSMLKKYLQHCDRVKFAKYTPSMDEMNNIYVSARDFINRTKETEKEPEDGK